jgi:hypothetical protein
MFSEHQYIEQQDQIIWTKSIIFIHERISFFAVPTIITRFIIEATFPNRDIGIIW